MDPWSEYGSVDEFKWSDCWPRTVKKKNYLAQKRNYKSRNYDVFFYGQFKKKNHKTGNYEQLISNICSLSTVHYLFINFYKGYSIWHIFKHINLLFFFLYFEFFYFYFLNPLQAASFLLTNNFTSKNNFEKVWQAMIFISFCFL